MYPPNRLPQPFDDVRFAVNFPMTIPQIYESLLHSLGYFVEGRRSCRWKHIGDVEETLEALFAQDNQVGQGEEHADDLYRFAFEIHRDWLDQHR